MPVKTEQNFYFDTAVEQIEKTEGGYRIHAGEKTYETRCVVNAAGVYADVFHNMVSEKKIRITPRKGEYYLLDKKAGTTVHHTIFQIPGTYGKGSPGDTYYSRQSSGGSNGCGY